MDDLKSVARQAKQRLKSDFWRKCKSDVDKSALAAREQGLNESKVKSRLYGKVKSSIKGEESDEFYLKVKDILDTYGEVSDAIGRLTDREYYTTLSYEERQKYTLELSSKYLAALEKYKREKEIQF
ncbi:MAG: hypothetical protein ACI4L9_05120 [Candidatus Coproplasma sp.]